MVKLEGDIAPSQATQKPVLIVQDVCKKFCRNLKRSYVYGLKDIGSELLGLRRESPQLRKGEFWALQNINFELERGQSMGIVGLNGSGKTTLLRIISGLMKPDRGEVNVRGRISALIALGAGFNPLLSGRENAFINMSILGLSADEIVDAFDQVVNFAELWEAIDSPVRTYSSGMRARLGFACAVYARPTLLLIDEVLAVGDVQFRTKCYRKLDQLRAAGTSFLMVAHNPNIILRTCDSALYLQQGKVIGHGPTHQVMGQYDADLRANPDSKPAGNLAIGAKKESSGVDITAVLLRDGAGQVIDTAYSGHPLKLCIHCRIHMEVDQLGMGVLIGDAQREGDWLLNLYSSQETAAMTVTGHEMELQLVLPYCGLRPGDYTAKITVFRYPFFVFDLVESFKFRVKSQMQMNQCAFFQAHSWQTLPVPSHESADRPAHKIL
jgi:lipopolysaccharide transport system ATP-binding protein